MYIYSDEFRASQARHQSAWEREQEERQAGRRRALADVGPRGHFTGRCGSCGSSDLWDDATAYGCRSCGAVSMTG